MKKTFITAIALLTSIVTTAQNEIMNVYNTDGTTIMYSAPVSTINKITFTPLAVGAAHQGGVIAYILQAGDPGYVSGETHGLITTTTDLSAGIQWAGAYTATGATGTAIGTGNANTIAIVTNRGAEANAAKLCADHVVGAYSDWYLPSKEELQKLYNNRAAIGGFTTSPYWSSSEYDTALTWDIFFLDGVSYNDPKILGCAVRAVRAF